jgi:formate hydrogenlyase subunit 3/multisubunit Na+/H+ antiporter MnhD subunit
MQLSLGVTSNMGLYLLGGMGAVAVLYGSFKAFTSPKLKLLIAYSTVAQIGYLFLAFPLVQSSPQQVKTAVLYFIVAHGCAKAAMFMSAGTVQKALGHDNLAELKGIVTRFPLSVFIFAIASASLIGLPPTGGFVAKWY